MLHNKQPGDAASSSSNDDVSLDTQTELVIYGRIFPGKKGQSLVSTNDKIFNENARMLEVIKTYTSKIMDCHHYKFNDDRIKRGLDESRIYLLMKLAESLDLLKRTNITTLKFSSFDIGSYNFLDRILRNSKITTLSFEVVNINLEELANILINTNITTLDLTACNNRDFGGYVSDSPLKVDRFALKLKDTNITTLSLPYNNMTHETLIDLAQGLKDSKITSLDLRNNNMHEYRIFSSFASHLKNSKITTLGIDVCEDDLYMLGDLLRGTNVKILYANALNLYGQVDDVSVSFFIEGLQGTNVKIVNFTNLSLKNFYDSAEALIADALKETEIIQISGLPFPRSQEIEKVLQKNRDDLKQKLEYIGRALSKQHFYVKKEIVKLLYLPDYFDNLDSAFPKESSLFGEGHGEQTDPNIVANVAYKASKFQELSEAASRGKNSGELDLTQVLIPLFMKKASPEFIKQYLSHSLNAVLKEKDITKLKLNKATLTDETMDCLVNGIKGTKVTSIDVINDKEEAVEFTLSENLNIALSENSYVDNVTLALTNYANKKNECNASNSLFKEVRSNNFEISEIQSILGDIKVGRKSVKDLRDTISTYEKNRMNPIMREEFWKARALSGNYDALILIAKGPTQGLFFDIKK